jgi:YD repeat-containing protein
MSMGYDKENRLVTYLAAGTSVSYVYAGSGLKRTEWNAGTPTTLIWDGQDYLKEKS